MNPDTGTLVMNKKELTRLIKTEAGKSGFAACGISRAESLDTEADRLKQWLSRNMYGEMLFMADHFDVRLDPRKCMPGAASVVSLAYNYYHPRRDEEPPAYRISMYSYGLDYHRIIKKKLQSLVASIREAAGDIQARSCVDSAPIMEKAWAARSGLGWIGKNTTLVMPRAGSFFFLAEVLLDIELEYDRPIGDHCGNCTRCIEACPTGAIVEPYVIDATKCISYLTIELKSPIPDSMAGTYEDWIFGCDACQEVCPFNRFATPHQEPAFNPPPDIFSMSVDDWRKLTPRRYEELFRGSAVKRTAYDGLMRNVRFLGG